MSEPIPRRPNRDRFDHEKLIVYRRAVDFVVFIEKIAREGLRRRLDLLDQIRRAGASICNNTAEGAGEFAPREKQRFYRIARRSATESAATLDMARRIDLIGDASFQEGRTLLLAIVAMLTPLAKPRGPA